MINDCYYYYFYLRRSFESGDYFDVIFSVHKEIFKCHRCLLSARCEYFNEMFHNKWKSRKIIYLNNARVGLIVLHATNDTKIIFN